MSAAPAPIGRQIKGPSAVGTDARRFWQLTWSLAVTDFKLRFFGSVLGYVWTLMRPLLLFAVLLLVFTVVLDFGGDVEYYPQALLLGIVLYTFFAEATTMSVRCLVDRENLVRKIDFPRLAVPLSVVLQALFNLVLNLLVVLLFVVVAGARVRWTWLELIPITALLAFLAFGLAMLLSTLYVRYRDIQPIWEVFVQAFFYLSPIFYTVELVRERYSGGAAEWIMASPFAALLQQARHAVIDPTHPTSASAAGGNLRLLIPLGITVALFVIGAQLFRRRAPRMAEEL